MKRFFQSVAVAIIGVVAMQPGLAGLLCAAPTAPCPMVISDMGPNCGGVSKADLDGSRPAVSVHAIPRSMASVALPATRKAVGFAVPNAPVEALPATPSASFVRAPAPARAESPPIYLRNRVFRI